jgi:hypothetical protein
MKKANKAKKAGKPSLAKGVSAVLSGKFLTRDYVQSNLTFIFFVVGIMICYIGYGYFAEKNAKDLVQTEAQLKEMKSTNLAVRARLEKLKQQSQVAESIRDLGLRESTSPPSVIRIDQSQNKSQE